IMTLPSGHYDCFIMASDLAMILDADITAPSAGALQIHTQTPFSISPADLEQEGYFYGVNSVLVGDATTGEFYYRYQSDTPYPIASTSKLMTCLLTMDAISAGQLSLEEMVTISEAAQVLSASDDGVVPLTAGEQITVQELLLGALLPSSNECALCLAEAIAGSEEAFVQMMNQKALEIGLSQATFFNCNGLPSYTQEPIPSKRQNRMSAEDMFRLVSYLLRVYPQVTDMTSLESATLQSLDLEVRNTNPLLHNLSEVTGLKTGTTNRSGACLVTSLSADDGNMGHNLVVVVLGTEDSIERGRVSELLAKYALQAFHAGIEETETGEVPQNLPTHAEAAVDRILRTARR
ncbi:MAG: D-alanyl-D-alanine carboxypeptidase, partial [Lachnospiraceae bacterium]|nr:D-alanyl-D-alanine carboxypeptidase [Lachnospiraceae bacterium]